MTDLPSLPGVYFFRSTPKKILYIGKTKSLRKRVRSYLYKSKRHPTRIKRLVHHATAVYYEICGSELKALLLEARLIREHQPPYNSALKEGRRSWFVKINLADDFPRVELTSERLRDHARYFGPFSSRRWTEEVIDSLYRVSPFARANGRLRPILISVHV